MNSQGALNALWEQATHTGLLEWIAILAAVAEVLLARANKMALYPAGLLSTGIYTWLFLQQDVHLYADALLNVYYFIMSIYGWITWKRRSGDKPLQVTKLIPMEWVFIVLLAGLAWIVLATLLITVFPAYLPQYVTSDVAVWDALIAGTAWVGMWLLARRKIANWLLLNVSNLVAIPIYLYKGMPLTAALTLFLFIVAISGYFEWKKIYKSQYVAA